MRVSIACRVGERQARRGRGRCACAPAGAGAWTPTRGARGRGPGWLPIASGARGGLLAALGVILAAGLGCGLRTRTETRDYDEQGRRADGYSVQATVVGKERAQLDTARALARVGDYAAAITALTPLHGRRDLDPELQQDILLTLGEMHAAPLNAHRDYAKSRQYLEELVRDHPDSEHADRARKLLDDMPR